MGLFWWLLQGLLGGLTQSTEHPRIAKGPALAGNGSAATVTIQFQRLLFGCFCFGPPKVQRFGVLGSVLFINACHFLGIEPVAGEDKAKT